MCEWRGAALSRVHARISEHQLGPQLYMRALVLGMLISLQRQLASSYENHN
jgi:hypothetical protein